MQLFRHEKLDDNITRIFGATNEIMYLIEGSKKAALIDTGMGIGSIREYVEKLTDKPITVILTHGHMDHAMGASQFSDVYMNSADDELYKEHCSMDSRIMSIKEFIGDQYYEIKDNIRPAEPLKHKKLFSGMNINLGGINLEIYDGKGHTKGSVVILIKEKRIMILGDACNKNTILSDSNSLEIREYMDTMVKLKRDTSGKYDKVYFSHESGEGQAGYVESMIDVCRTVLNGEDDKVPYTFMGMQAYVAKRRNENMDRYDGGLANLVYTDDKIS